MYSEITTNKINALKALAVYQKGGELLMLPSSPNWAIPHLVNLQSAIDESDQRDSGIQLGENPHRGPKR